MYLEFLQKVCVLKVWSSVWHYWKGVRTSKMRGLFRVLRSLKMYLPRRSGILPLPMSFFFFVSQLPWVEWAASIRNSQHEVISCQSPKSNRAKHHGLKSPILLWNNSFVLFSLLYQFFCYSDTEGLISDNTEGRTKQKWWSVFH